MTQKLPQVRGQYRENVELSRVNWFNIGGPAEVVFKPADAEDLGHFLQEKPKNILVTVIGVGSNLLVRDAGIQGVVIRLGRGFTTIEAQGEEIIAGAGALDVNVSVLAAEKNITGLEFLSGIPGTIGGALAMNAGAYGAEMSNVLISAETLDEHGKKHHIPAEKMGFSYRKNSIPKDWIFTSARLKGKFGNSEKILGRMREISASREETQPIRTRTSGSTFKNPPGMKAWELIEKAGCRGLTIGGAQVSEKHCNFFINSGGATASEMEKLFAEVQKRVLEKTGISLELEIKVIGKHA